MPERPLVTSIWRATFTNEPADEPTRLYVIAPTLREAIDLTVAFVSRIYQDTAAHSWNESERQNAIAAAIRHLKSMEAIDRDIEVIRQ